MISSNKSDGLLSILIFK